MDNKRAKQPKPNRPMPDPSVMRAQSIRVEEAIHELGMWLDDMEHGEDKWEQQGFELCNILRKAIAMRRLQRTGKQAPPESMLPHFNRSTP